MCLFKRVLGPILGSFCLILGLLMLVSGPAAADPPAHSNSEQSDGRGQSGEAPPQNDRRGNSDTSGAGGSGSGARGGSTAGGGGTAGGNSGSNPDGGGLDKPDCETAAEGCQGPAPRDDNNGCGNEAEPKSVRDDDNNGNCGGGQHKDTDESTAGVGTAAARGAWTGKAGKVFATALRTAAFRAGYQAVGAELDASNTDRAGAEVMGVSAERSEAGIEEVDLDDLELARERSSRSGGRSLLAMTGMALMALLVAGLFILGLGRLFRTFEDAPQ